MDMSTWLIVLSSFDQGQDFLEPVNEGKRKWFFPMSFNCHLTNHKPFFSRGY